MRAAMERFSANGKDEIITDRPDRLLAMIDR
jgi:hypothetical protein